MKIENGIIDQANFIPSLTTNICLKPSTTAREYYKMTHRIKFTLLLRDQAPKCQYHTFYFNFANRWTKIELPWLFLLTDEPRTNLMKIENKVIDKHSEPEDIVFCRGCITNRLLTEVTNLHFS